MGLEVQLNVEVRGEFVHFLMTWPTCRFMNPIEVGGIRSSLFNHGHLRGRFIETVSEMIQHQVREIERSDVSVNIERFVADAIPDSTAFFFHRDVLISYITDHVNPSRAMMRLPMLDIPTAREVFRLVVDRPWLGGKR